ncbi:MAG: phytanoyl-CoA dioxygenase family protein [Myxococcota bacterium]|nr:phytanoyl-CoA dioxygenase family protein [Myxococcota bacterium]
MSEALRETAPAGLTQLREQGYVILPRMLSPAQVARVRRELEPHLGPFGRNPFEGERTQRVYALLAKAPSIAGLVEHPDVLAFVDHFLAPSYWLWGALAINLHPGETRQHYHCDDDAGAPPRPRPAQGVSTMWSLDDFTGENGATELVPGSHTWGAGETPAVDDPRTRQVIMPAGSVLVWQGSVFHRGGANRSDRTRLGVTIQYSQPWLRQIENMVLAVPPEVAAQYSPRVRAMLGYGLMANTFMGYVDGRDPRRLVEACDPGKGSPKP